MASNEFGANFLRSKRLIDATFNDLEIFLEMFIDEHPSDDRQQSQKVYRGLAGIMEIFNCKKTKAAELKRDVIADAVHEHDGLMIIDKDKAIELFNSYNAKRHVKK